VNSKGLLRAHICLTTATTAFFAGTACGQANASQTHILKHGETVEFLGRHYHVALKDLLAANHLHADDILLDGRSLRIPDAPRPTIVPPTMRKEIRITGDRISIRNGPASSHHRLKLCDSGTKLVVTAEHNGWLQVTLNDGRIGWVRSDFVHNAGKSAPTNLAHHMARPKHALAVHLPATRTAAGAERLRHQQVLAVRASKTAHKPHEARHPLHEVSEHIRERHDEVAGARKRRHEENIARARHERHVMEAAAAKLHSNKATHGARHRAEELAAAHLHQKHLAEIKEAQRHKHLKEIADAHNRRDRDGGTETFRKKCTVEMAAAKPSSHVREKAKARRHHHEEELAHARRQKHLDEIAAARHQQHLEALAAIHRHHLAALANHDHRAAVAAARHHDTGRYTHKIRPEAESPSASNDVVRSAFAYRGTPYRWGEARPGGFDCSGFTKYIYGRKGVSLPRTAAEQFHAGSTVTHHGMKPGDLVFFHTTRRGISHVGMYVGNGKFVHSSSKKAGGVRVDNLDSGYYSKAFRGARRVRKETNEPSGE
jgi:cell wall-associated NlpC family hydrolase